MRAALILIPALLATLLAGCSASAPAPTAPGPGQNPPPMNTPAGAPTPNGPLASGATLRTLPVTRSEVALPQSVQQWTSTSHADGLALYQRPGSPGFASIQATALTIDRVAISLQDPLDYGDFICGRQTLGTSGVGCFVGLTDGHLAFVDAQGPDGTIEGSAAFTRAALEAMDAPGG